MKKMIMMIVAFTFFFLHSTVMAEHLKLTIESYSPATLPTVSKIIDVQDPLDQLEISRQAALFSLSPEGWNLQNYGGVLGSVWPPGFSDWAYYVRVLDPDNAMTSIYGYPLNAQSMAYGPGQRDLFFHTDRLVERLAHEIGETTNNNGVISGAMSGTYSQCPIPNWGRFYTEKVAVYGQILNYDGLTPISGLTIKATKGTDSFTTTSDISGNFAFIGLDTGDYIIELASISYWSNNKSITVTIDETAQLSIVAIPQAVLNNIIDGSVTQAQLNQAVSDANTAKDLVIAQRDQIIATRNDTIISKDQVISSLNESISQKEQTINTLNTTVASMFTKAQLDQAVNDANAEKDLIIVEKDQNISTLNTSISQKDLAIETLNTTIASMFTQAQLDKAVSDANAAKDVIIAQKDQTITTLNNTITSKDQTIASMFTKTQLDKAVADANAAKDLVIAAMFTKTQLDKAVTDANVAKNLIIAQRDQTIASMFTQTQMDKAVTDADAAKDLIIASMFTKAQLDQAVAEERIKWDINNDGYMGLEEVISILQKMAGAR